MSFIKNKIQVKKEMFYAMKRTKNNQNFYFSFMFTLIMLI